MNSFRQRWIGHFPCDAKFEAALPPFFRNRPTERPIHLGRGPSRRHKGWRQNAANNGQYAAARPEKILGEAAEAREIRPPRSRESSDNTLMARWI